MNSTATPRHRSIYVAAICEQCGERITATVNSDTVHAQRYYWAMETFAWYHAATGREECAR